MQGAAGVVDPAPSRLERLFHLYAIFMCRKLSSRLVPKAVGRCRGRSDLMVGIVCDAKRGGAMRAAGGHSEAGP
jgi:hypothetical protein